MSRLLVILISALVAWALIFFSLWMGVVVTLSYFQWSPFGYEPCGLQVIAWFLLVYPALILDLILRGVFCLIWKWSWRYLLAPIVAGLLFLPAIAWSGCDAMALQVIICAPLWAIGSAWLDVWTVHLHKKKAACKDHMPPGVQDDQRLKAE